MIPATSMRVPLNTADEVNEQIRATTLQRVAYYRDASPDEITARLQELDAEWDIERTLEANAAIVCMAGVTLGAIRHRLFFAVPFIVGGFLLQHAVQGWFPPLPIFRRLGVRTEREIDEERNALKTLRGDFDQIAGNALPPSAEHILDAAEQG